MYLVIYHANCMDGWCAAWILDRCLGGVELQPAQYGDQPPIVEGRNVIVVDFSYPRETMIQMHEEAMSFVVLDHHKTAEADCAGLNFCVFDMSESGATLAYKWAERKGLTFNLQPRDMNTAMRAMANYVRDRDLWLHRLELTQEVNAAIRSYPMELDVWDKLAMRLKHSNFELGMEGQTLLRYRDKLIEQHVGHARDVTIAGIQGKAVECTIGGEIGSDVAGKLAEQTGFGCFHFNTDKHTVVSLRSRGEGGIDVSWLAKKFGGGGHKNAAGFSVPYLMPRWDAIGGT